MFCPRCGTPNPETIKFCRQCGLALQQVSGYVSSGGTGALQPPPPASSPLARATEGLSAKQKMLLGILLWVFSPAIFKVIGDATGLDPIFDGMSKLAAVLMAPGIIWIVFLYRAQARKEREAAMLQSPQAFPPAYYQQIPPPTAQPVAPPQYYPPPAQQQPVHRHPAPPPTNPIGPIGGRGSVTEDETRKFQG
ncbi:MAG: zinc ribbon domain-containing protein [Blastocatellia bacterium]|nr:zinc ribbon domain-containing protein [Blastocatellia bacterium]